MENLIGSQGRQRAVFVALMGDIIRLHESKRYCCVGGNYMGFSLVLYLSLLFRSRLWGDFGLAVDGMAWHFRKFYF